jgi:hypothetical protein
MVWYVLECFVLLCRSCSVLSANSSLSLQWFFDWLRAKIMRPTTHHWRINIFNHHNLNG